LGKVRSGPLGYLPLASRSPFDPDGSAWITIAPQE
jgi:hypothetical protein